MTSYDKVKVNTGKHNRAKFPDKTMGLKGGSVDKGATRGATAPTPKTIGPRKDGM